MGLPVTYSFPYIASELPYRLYPDLNPLPSSVAIHSNPSICSNASSGISTGRSGRSISSFRHRQTDCREARNASPSFAKAILSEGISKIEQGITEGKQELENASEIEQETKDLQKPNINGDIEERPG